MLYLLLFLLLWLLVWRHPTPLTPLPPSMSQKSSINEKKVTLNLKQFIPPSLQTPQPQKEIQAPTSIATQKKTKPKSTLIAKKMTEANLTKPHKSKRQKTIATHKKIPKIVPFPTTPKSNSYRKSSNTSLANMLMQQAQTLYLPSSSRLSTQSITTLYGKEFLSFTPTQQKFIREYLSEIQRITQNTLTIRGYPFEAVRMDIEGHNIVSFYLHPNGDITNVRLLKKIGYELLDGNTIEVIRTAYKGYPHPKTITKIIFDVGYELLD